MRQAPRCQGWQTPANRSRDCRHHAKGEAVEAYFDGTERDSVLGTYSITEEGATTPDAPLAAYRVEDGEVLPAR